MLKAAQKAKDPKAASKKLGESLAKVVRPHALKVFNVTGAIVTRRGVAGKQKHGDDHKREALWAPWLAATDDSEDEEDDADLEKEGEEWLDEHIADLIEGISEDAKDAIADALKNNPEDVEDVIRNYIGLNQNQVAALNKKRALWEDQGKTQEEIEQATRDYASDLLDARAELIARQETALAVKEGRDAAVQEMIDSGEVDPENTVQVWDAGPEACEECEELDGQEVEIGEPFEGNEGEYDGPPAHLQCDCDVFLAEAQ